MASKLRTLSSDEVTKFLEKHGFEVLGQRGSHIKLRRVSAWGKETVIVPYRKQIAKGTLKSIFNKASRFIPQDDIHEFFYTE
ncbi:MAG: hypothetical protein COV91_02535 [Candidatus Taylorbacteria bacterium CG11_big_fil_rev_8_21_14_0_20_46_11]|uniref:Type II toxin-antitoxin system HicA family toxin n=1 Tax=Candidatus Taylorbacteria bacterium CG11_big_fil_rev_8_21_14_0_20_46_11 TaxID=1975025 RepID=A0A2H0KDR3_9BACT|nr:MAG: hypothetical protein COV91_02535 [Candidatus Taylorbacteria bacterium CG11_big_fil_rev_8_21_14_0_20_46_11]